MKYLSFSILIAPSFAALASAVSDDVEISQRHRNLDNDEPFKLLFQSTHERFTPDKEWCLTAKRDGIGSLIHVRECELFDEDETNLQLWERYDHNQLKLSDSSRNLCLRARHRRIYLHTCQQKTDYRNSFIVDESNNYIEHDNDDGIQFLLGLRRSNVMGRVLLMQANTRSILDNDTLTWNVRYVSQTSAPTTSPMPSSVQGGGERSIPVPSPVESPTLSPSQVESPTLSPSPVEPSTLSPNQVKNAKEKKKKKNAKKKNKKNKKNKKKKKKKKTQQ
ncbi:predicted protein [Chaetoceros tenuissimus]|uniref:Ricin B lectin domain-containing protein n=1 Tax=Chaetoceros tenuissimus TaxID=426638 RepID=A0AAD3H0C5_9STRA|nr:predicted protein [Chaetoceros tenuissimus]